MHRPHRREYTYTTHYLFCPPSATYSNVPVAPCLSELALPWPRALHPWANCSFHYQLIAWSSPLHRFCSLVASATLLFLITHGFCLISCLSTPVFLLTNTHSSKMRRQTERLMESVNHWPYFGMRSLCRLEAGSGSHLCCSHRGQGGKVLRTTFPRKKTFTKCTRLFSKTAK